MKETTQRIVTCLSLAAAAVLLPVGANANQVVDLISNSSVTAQDGVTWSTTALQPTGTGRIDPFLRVQDSNDTGGSEQGYNTSGIPRPMDDLSNSGSGNNYVHSVMFGDMDTSGGAIKLLLDANQTGAQPALSLTKFVIWLTAAPSAGTAQTLSALTAELGTPAYDMDATAGGNKQVNIPVQGNNGFDANHGSGSGDMNVLVPLSVLQNTGTFFTLYCEFAGPGIAGGLNPLYINNDGFEEWAFERGPNAGPVPDGGSTLALLGSALAGLGFCVRRFGAAIKV